MTGLRYSPLLVTELCGEMQGKFIVGCARLINLLMHLCSYTLRVSHTKKQYCMSHNRSKLSEMA